MIKINPFLIRPKIPTELCICQINRLLLIYSNAYALFFNMWIGKEYRFNPVINAFAWDRNVAWWTVSLFLKPFTKFETNRTPRDIAISCLSIYYKFISIILVYSTIEECSIGIAVNKYRLVLFDKCIVPSVFWAVRDRGLFLSWCNANLRLIFHLRWNMLQ